MIRINTHPSRRQLRQFAVIWLPLGGLGCGMVVYWRSGAAVVALAIWSATAALAAASVASPAVAEALYLGLSYASYPGGFVVSWLALAAVYFVVITPVGLASRAAGRDPLQLRRTRRVASWWHGRGESDDSARAFRQF